MLKEYSLESLVFANFPECFEKISKSVKYDKIEVVKGLSSERVEYENIDIFKELSEKDLPIFIYFIKDGSKQTIFVNAKWRILRIDIGGFGDRISIDLFRIIEESLCVSKPTEKHRRSQADFSDIVSLLWRIYDKTEEILNQSKFLADESRKSLRCFVSFRFDDHSKALAFELREFLKLIAVAFISGLGYEPRSISEKVLDRLSGALDLFIVIHSFTGDSAWLNQEIGVARARKLPILVIREEGSEADIGMLGDTEYLLFPEKNISKAFVGILQALSYVTNKPIPT